MTTYTTWNPADKGAAVTLSGGNLVATKTTNNTWTGSGVRAAHGLATGKYYFEILISAVGDTNIVHMIGLGNSSASLSTNMGADNNSWSLHTYSGDKYHGGVNAAYGNQSVLNDIIGVAVDLNAHKIWWAENNTWFASGNPASGTNEAYSNLTGTLYPMTGAYDSPGAVTARFDPASFTYTTPSGFTPGWPTSAVDPPVVASVIPQIMVVI